MIENLKQKYLWPIKRPFVPPYDDSTFQWFSRWQSDILRIYAKPGCNIIELGSFLGSSTRYFSQMVGTDGCVFAIDHWKGNVEHVGDNYQQVLPILYDAFIDKCWDYQHNIVPVRENTLDGMQIIYDENIPIHLIYVDASHDTESVTSDITLATKLFPGVPIVGDDWQWDNIKKLVSDFARDNQYQVWTNGVVYSLFKMEGFI